MNLIELKKAVEYMNLVKFGAYISRLRKERDMPQSKLADMLSVTRQAVSKWERGEGFPDISILCELANIFGVSVDALINAGGVSENEAAILSAATKNEQIAEEILENKSVIQDIINIAPYLKVSNLSAIAEQLAKHNIDISKIVELSEFMNDESIVKLFGNSDLENLSDELLIKLMPFLDKDSHYAIFERVMNGQNSPKLPLRDYIGHSVIEAAWMQGVLPDDEILQVAEAGKSNGRNDIVLKNIGKEYPNDIIAVRDFNLEIKSGEVIVLVGPSGCGKTTTLRMIAGLEEITGGELYIDGKLINNVHPKDRGLSMVFQDYALFPHMTAFDNIAFGLKPDELPASEIKAKVEEIAQTLDITHLLNYKPAQLSGGQQQRVSLARAMVRENKIILLDEPFSNLDAKLRVYMRVEMMKLHKKYNGTFIYVTHDQNDAMRLADRIVVMRDGIIQQVGTPEELYANPCNLFVAAFLGSQQMNLWDDAKIIEQDGDIYVDFAGLKIKLAEVQADKASAYIGKPVIAGVRPNDLYEDEANLNKFSEYILDTVVEVMEFIGENIYLHVRLEQDAPFNLRSVHALPDCAARDGDKIKIAVNPEKIYLFDKQTELAIY